MARVDGKRMPLDFVPAEPDPLAGVPDGAPPEVQIKRELDAFGKAFREAAKKEAADSYHEKEGYGAECIMLVFQDADQATAFLRRAEYPGAKEVFVDGVLLAELLGIPLPAPIVGPPKPIKIKQDPKLVRLVDKAKLKKLLLQY